MIINHRMAECLGYLLRCSNSLQRDLFPSLGKIDKKSITEVTQSVAFAVD
jgi:hypothetical protein